VAAPSITIVKTKLNTLCMDAYRNALCDRINGMVLHLNQVVAETYLFANFHVTRLLDDPVFVRRLLIKGINFHENDYTALVYSVQLNKPEIVKLLLIDPDARHGAALISASKQNNLKIVRQLVLAGANVNIMDGCPRRVAADTATRTWRTRPRSSINHH